ncbi:hypothetical protein KI387_020927 [Taxus chinensis]|uniref:Reverse transcriptase n=1 Tax=Taxus chinensis TaxID=29808 RepID=A0AA38LBT1_TAXCH|nr:hypothetical protein KI387_020927 [Taxus chinensis]
MADSLSRALEAAKNQSIISGMKITSNCPSATHSQFADDTLLLSLASVIEARAIMDNLSLYQSASQQTVNFNKSSISFINTPPRSQRKIADIFGCIIVDLPASYLGIPLFQGRQSKNLWNPVIERYQKKLAAWKGALLSQASKLQLVKATLQNLPTYFMSLLKIPSSVREVVEKIQRKFLWSGTEDKKRIHLVAWKEVCKPTTHGGLGLRKMNGALLAKLAWEVAKGDSCWAHLLRAKYLANNKDLLTSIPIRGSAIWNSISSSIPIIRAGTKWRFGNGRLIDF